MPAAGLLAPLVIGALTGIVAARGHFTARTLRQITLFGLAATAQFTVAACFAGFAGRTPLAWIPAGVCAAAGVELMVRALREGLPDRLTTTDGQV